jgi:quercetin dioxygenase-like cupin family protein
VQPRHAFLAIVLFAAVHPAAFGQASGSHATGHNIVAGDAIKWGPAPASLPPGAQAAVLYGDPGKEGQFALRLRLPAGYHIPPHTHPKPEVVTVLSGNFRLGMGEKADRSKAQSLRAGSFFAFEPGMAHFAYTEGETVVQLNSTGPWGITYVNPADDPRKK